ncbi:MAG TPA: phosphotransferase [Acidimicrobiales bacterium]|nr:phosphotransferase [Acidimicrobiales bacterium]
MSGPGALIASGRDADVFAYGDRLVLRRSRQGRSMVAEAKVMEYARAQGYPTPAVDHLSDDGTDLVMERVDGPSMVEVLGRRPWTLRANGALLGDLHRRLHEIPAPDWVRPGPGPDGRSLLHLDLHPLNVLIGSSGPVVIDWTNAARGAGATDVALTWVLMAAGEIPGNRLKAAVMGRARGALVGAFLGRFDLEPVRSSLRAVVEWKVTDPHMSDIEQRRMWEVARTAGRAAG